MDTLFLQSRSQASGFTVLLEEEASTAYLYLLKSDDKTICSHALAFCMGQLATQDDWTLARKNKTAPPLTEDLASAEGTIRGASRDDFEFVWSKNGEAAALQHKGKSIAIVSAEQRYGYSRAVRTSSPAAQAWDDGVHRELFAGEA